MNPLIDLGDPSPRRRLEGALVAEPPRLDLAALAIASLGDGGERPEDILQRLDALAGRVRREGGGREVLDQVLALRRVLADEEGFTGNTVDAAAPDNSFLPRVLETRVGLPIALSVVYLEVARRAGIPLFGVGFPGHFVVAAELPAGRLVLDPFHAGRILTTAGCEDLLRVVAPRVKFSPSMITAAPVKAITYRMLNNLKRTYLERGDGEKALRVVDLMLAVVPDHPGDLRARAAILSALGAYRAALADIERCLAMSPSAPDHENLELTARALRQRVELLN